LDADNLDALSAAVEVIVNKQETSRQIALHSLGNLTLLTQPLNSGVSDGPFRQKRPQIAAQSLLKLNSYFQGFSNDDKWDELRIRERSESLAGLACRIWGYPPA